MAIGYSKRDSETGSSLPKSLDDAHQELHLEIAEVVRESRELIARFRYRGLSTAGFERHAAFVRDLIARHRCAAALREFEDLQALLLGYLVLEREEPARHRLRVQSTEHHVEPLIRIDVARARSTEPEMNTRALLRVGTTKDVVAEQRIPPGRAKGGSVRVKRTEDHALARAVNVGFPILIALGIAFGIPFAAAQEDPSLSLSPTTGPAGSVTTATGSGFVRSGCVNMFFDSLENLLQAQVPVENGSFSVAITIPGNAAPGSYKIIALGLLSGVEFCGGASDEQASAGFVVVAVPPTALGPVTPRVFGIDLRDLPVVPPWQPGDPILEADAPLEPIIGSSEAGGGEADVGATPATSSGSPVDFLTPLLSFDGILAGVAPPDTVGDVGPLHFIQARNFQFAVYDKQGNQLAGPTNINCLWRGTTDCSLAAGETDPCAIRNRGDPDVKYDPLADRWLISQFTGLAGQTTFNQCVAISRAADPVTGGWFLYTFPMQDQDGNPIVNDYPKFGVWPDAYYMGTNRGYGAGDAWAFDRDRMIAGATTRATIRRDVGGVFMLPSDLDGTTPPPVGAPNVFVRFVDGAEFGGDDRLELAEFHVDFGTPGGSTFAFLADLPTGAFDSSLCGFGMRPQCITQPGTAQLLDTLRGVSMYRLQYRNFGTHETLVFNHAVDADGANLAGIRWYELRKQAGAWSIFQQGTFSPDDTHRWMGSVAMDRVGNIAIGYSVSDGSTVFPGVRYAGRLASDPAGTMPRGEVTVIAGGGSQPGSRRWGDYSSMSVDPVDDCTFWYTTEYIPFTGSAPRTRIVSFRFEDCPITVRINIRPGSFPNPVNLRAPGVIPVAILTTRLGEYGLPVAVDATTILPMSVHFGPRDVLLNGPTLGGATEFHGTGHIEDSLELDEVTMDGDLDLVLHFLISASGLDEADTEACVKGTIVVSGMMFLFFGCDSVLVRP